MIASTQITNTEVLTLIAVLAFKLLTHKLLFIKGKENRNLKCRLLFKKIASFTGKSLQNYK